MNSKLLFIFIASVCLLLSGYVFLVVLLLRQLPTTHQNNNNNNNNGNPTQHNSPTFQTNNYLSAHQQSVLASHPHRPWNTVFHNYPSQGHRIEQDILRRTDPKLPVWRQYTPGCPQIDVVYTYVNGSDPVHIDKRWQRSGKKRKDSARYRDVDQLRYSLRSVHEYAPWVRHVWVVTDDQVPVWLNGSHPHVTVIDHTAIFRSRPHTALPTFNSNAIELNMHHIPGLAECFIYMNDDMFLGRESRPEHFWIHETGQQVLYFEGWTPATTDKEIKALRNIWKKSVAYTNRLLDGVLGIPENPRHFYTHGVYFFKKQYLRELEILFGPHIAEAQDHPFRTPTDVTLPLLYGNYVKAVYPYVERKPMLGFGTITLDYDKTRASLKRLQDRRPTWVCINDGFGEGHNEKVVALLQEVLEQWLPRKSPFEKTLPAKD